MKKGSELVMGILIAAVVAIGGLVIYLLERKPAVLEKVKIAAPTLAPKTGCTPDQIQAGVQAAVAGGEAGAQAGAAGAAAGAATGVATLLSGPCGDQIAKKLELLANSSIRQVREGAMKALRQADTDRRIAQDVSTGGPLRRAAVAATKKSVKGIRKRLHLG